MAETRKTRIDKIFEFTPKHGDERGKSKWRERYEKNLASAISYTNKFKKIFHSKTVSQTKAISSKETKPQSSIQELSTGSKSSFKKPPFIVPGRIIYNDLYLLQSLSQGKNPAPVKKTLTRTDVVKVAATKYETSTRHILGKLKSANVAKHAESTTDSCPQCKGFIPPTGLTTKTKKIAPLEHENDLQTSCRKTSKDSSTPNAWITDKRTSTQKPFSSLLNSPEPCKPQVSHFLDSTDLGSSEESSDHEVNSSDDQHHNNQNENGPEVNESAIQQMVSHRKMEIKEDALKQNLNVENVEIAQQLRAQINEKKMKLDQLCLLWNNKLKEENCVPNEEIGSVFTVIGQTQQLQRERFYQYADFILKFETNSGEKEITETDLQGFWEMILLQVTDVENKFSELDSLQRGGWVRKENFENQTKKTKNLKKKKKTNVEKVNVSSSGIKSHIASLRKKQRESKNLLTTSVAYPYAYADSSSCCMLNPIENYDDFSKRDQIIQSAMENTTNEGFSSPSDKRGQITQPTIENISNDECSTPSPLSKLIGNCSTEKRKKHKSASNALFFSSPHQTDSPRQRSHSTSLLLDQHLVVPRSTQKEEISELEIPQIFPTSVRQYITRTGRTIHSPNRFGNTEEQKNSSYSEMSKCLSPLQPFITRSGRLSRSPDRFGQAGECKASLNPPQSRQSQFTKPQQMPYSNTEESIVTHGEDITTNKEENNNDVN